MSFRPWAFAGLAFSFAASSLSAQTITKLADIPNTPGQPASPNDGPLLVGRDLWFTTTAGGSNAFGTVAKYNLDSGALTTVVDMDNVTGNTPQSSLTRVGDDLFYTTSRGGTGDRGTINLWNLTDSKNTVLFNSPSNADPNHYAFPGNVTYVQRGNNTASLYAMYGSGGPNDAFGGILKLDYNTTTKAVTGSSIIHSFLGGATHGRQPMEGFTQVGNKLYFTTFAGGPASTGYNNGAGMLGVVDLTNDSVTESLAVFPGNGDNFGFAAHNPTYDAVANALYIPMVGTAAQPGGIMKFDITTGVLSQLFALDDRTGTGANPSGAWIYGELALIGRTLYFGTTDGGPNDGGTIAKFDLETGLFTKLADLNPATGDNLGGEIRGGPMVSFNGESYDVYFLTKQGGTADKGTILYMNVAVPEPTSMGLMLLGISAMSLGRWRRNRAEALEVR